MVTLSRIYIAALVAALIGSTGYLTYISGPHNTMHTPDDAQKEEARVAHFPTRVLSYVDDGSQETAASIPTLSSLVQTAQNFIAPKPDEADTHPIHVYGNILGKTLQEFAGTHTDLIEILKRHADARTESNAAAVVRLADDYAAVAASISAIDAPEELSTQNRNLAQAYGMLAEKLRAVASTKSDSDFLAAIDAENESAEGVAHALTAIITVFKLHGISFASWEAGAVFEEGR